MAGKTEPKFLRCTSGFVLPDRRVVKGGQVVAADDPVVKGRERYFEPLDAVVEQATRAPGELRVTSRARAENVVAKATPAKKAGD